MKYLKSFIAFIFVVTLVTACSSGKNANNQVNSSTVASTSKQDTNTTTFTTLKQSMETTISTSRQGETSPISDEDTYKKYVTSLSKRDFKSIGLAYKKFIECKSDDKSKNDNMFRDFYEYYNSVFNNITNALSEGNTFDEKELKQNGFIILEYEEGKFIFMDPDFLVNSFLPYVSNGTAEFIKLDNKDKKIRNGGLLITDGLLIIKRDALSDILAEWERYTKDFPQYPWECKYSKENAQYYIGVYTDVELNTFSDMNGETKLSTDILQSYKRFLEKYPDSGYYQLIKEYHAEVQKNGVKKTSTTTKILKKYGIDAG